MSTSAIADTQEFEAHAPHVAHHFSSAQQQFDAGKLGMWLFLATEVLFFSGLFVAYAVYRSRHPEVFVDAHKYLNTTLGAFNTLVLLFSSLTMAWSVRCAQLGQRKLLVILLSATLACASLFLGVKAVEYAHKWGAGLLWAGAISGNADVSVTEADVQSQTVQALVVLSLPALVSCLALAAAAVVTGRGKRRRLGKFWLLLLLAALTYFLGVGAGQLVEHFSTHQDHHHEYVASETPIASPSVATAVALDADNTNYMGVFFSIYYAMTGVHALHIIVGMGVIAWVLFRSLRGDFSPQYFGPVDYVGLYWHLVDVVWIYLFPLLYLIR